MRMFARTFIVWIPLAIAIVGLCLLVYGTVQQNYRQSLNDPQIQMAEDAARYLQNAPVDPSKILTLDATGVPVDIATSLSPWIALVSADGSVYQNTTSGFLNNQPLQFPTGVLQSAANNEGKDTDQLFEDRVTWQPEQNVRQAIVVVAVTNGKYKGDFVVAGRDMREVENRESALAEMIWLCMAMLLLCTFVAKMIVQAILKRWR
ncbi:MAG TPA: hypothetical protein VMU27_03525 [Candidatus Paceibacterota bacterium]|nr:hypothetical protein [Candidatus Paceibacterota bacterium]